MNKRPKRITISLDKELEYSFDKGKEIFGSNTRFVIWMFFKTKHLILDENNKLTRREKRLYLKKENDKQRFNKNNNHNRQRIKRKFR